MNDKDKISEIGNYITRIDFEFDERSFAKIEPLGRKHGIVRVIYGDRTGNAKQCTRDTLNATIAELINAKITQLLLEARINERNQVALDNYRGHTFSDSTNWEAKFAKFIDNNEKILQQLKDSKGRLETALKEEK